MTATRILLADDHGMVRRGLRLVLDAEPDLRVVAEAGDGADAVAAGLREEIDLRCSTSRCHGSPGSTPPASLCGSVPTCGC
jgi:DNA-binding NarL/FixJ family response regulator